MSSNFKNHKALIGLENLINEALNGKNSDDVLKKVTSNFTDLGEIANHSIMENIKKSLIFTPPSALYGNRYGKNILCRWELKSGEKNIFLTDEEGVLKNGYEYPSTKIRIYNALKNKTPVFFFFGGSTTMSVGSLTPDFSIPSLIERIFKIKFNKPIVCVNFGSGGTCVTEASSLYLHDSRKLLKSANVIFYDGWNCASYLTLMNQIKEQNFKNEKNKINLFNGDSIRQLEHNFVLSKIYDLPWHLSRVKNLILAYILDFFYKYTPTKILKKVLKAIQSRMVSLKPNDDLQKFYSTLDDSEDKINRASRLAVEEYIDLHETINSVCQKNGGNFFWFQQPLVFWGRKPLTKNEKDWRDNGFSSGNPRIFKIFEKNFNSSFKEKYKKNEILKFKDLTNIFCNTHEEVYIDSGHLNRMGNLIVAAEISKEIEKVVNVENN